MESVPLPAAPWMFERIPGGYETRCPDLGITMVADEIERKRDDLTALLCVRSTMVGLRPALGTTLRVGRLNFHAVRSRNEWAREIAKRCPGEAADLDWDGYLEQFVQQVITAEREGEPPIILSEYDAKPGSGQFMIPKLWSAEEVTIWFGDGGSMKSYLMLAAIVALSEGTSEMIGLTPSRPRRVGLVDWEYTPDAHRRRLDRLCGYHTPDLVYIRADRPIRHEVDRLRRIVHEHSLDALVIDSIIGACDGPAEQSEVAADFFRAIRQVGVPVLAIGHRSKAEDGDVKPFGSAFWHNLARLTWFVEKSQHSEDRINIALHNRKNNDGPLYDPVGFSFYFDTMRTTVQLSDISADPKLAERLPLRVRLIDILSAGPMTYAELAAETGENVDTVSKTVRREAQREAPLLRLVTGTDHVTRVVRSVA